MPKTILGKWSLGLIAIIKQKERSPLVYNAIVIGGLFMLFLAGEVLFPH